MNWLDELDSRRRDIRREDVTRLIAIARSEEKIRAAAHAYFNSQPFTHTSKCAALPVNNCICGYDALRESLNEPEPRS